ncbi:hypothetical protein LJC74_10205 [Eubacteriales bacterium OttesenSCG-928-A19]|nr:hypothetical protein [Eubacteriales bacterium OttesenSCG-928-A19]
MEKERATFAELLIIKRDCDLLCKIMPQTHAVFSFSISPFCSLIITEAVSYINEHGATEFHIPDNDTYPIEKIRLKAKFFDGRFEQNMRIANNLDFIQNEHFANAMKYPELKNWNLHDNLGIYFDENGKIIGNTQYAYYMYRDDRILRSEMTHALLNYSKEEMHTLGYQMGKVIGELSRGFATLSDFVGGLGVVPTISFSYKDYNTNRLTFSDNDEYQKSVSLLLLHLLCFINYSLYGIDRYILRDSGLGLRIKYITMHYAYNHLRQLNNSAKKLPNDIALMLSKIDFENYGNTPFRNCMMHYGLYDSNEQRCLISPDFFDTALPLCGLVETFFDGRTYSNVKTDTDNKLRVLSELIADTLSIDADGRKPL